METNEGENMYKFNKQESGERLNPSVILASSSKNRLELFHRLGIPFNVVPSIADEKSINETDPVKKVTAISKLKAEEVASRHEGIIVAADTFTTINGKHYEKPIDLENARQMLKDLSGQKGNCVYGICIIDTNRGTQRLAHEVVDIQIDNLADSLIEEYITSRPVTQWAAAYNPLDEFSASIFQPAEQLKPGYAYGIPGDILAEELQKAGITIDLTRLNTQH